MEQNRGIEITTDRVIGHVTHGKSVMIAAIASILADKRDMVVVDENNLEQMQEALTRHRTFEFTAPQIPEIVHWVPGPKNKQHKPNKGIQIGSYRYRKKK